MSVRTRRILDLAGVDAVLTAAEKAAVTGAHRMVIVVVDPSGRALALRRTEGSQAASDQVAIDKARTAAIFMRPSRGGPTGPRSRASGLPPTRPAPRRSTVDPARTFEDQ